MWRLLQFFWNRHYQGVWQALQGHQWSQQLMPMIEALTVKTRDDLVELIGCGGPGATRVMAAARRMQRPPERQLLRGPAHAQGAHPPPAPYALRVLHACCEALRPTSTPCAQASVLVRPPR